MYSLKQPGLIEFMKKFAGQVWNYLFGKDAHILMVPSLIYLKRKRKVDVNYFDYVRTGALELIAYEIHKNKLAGAVAELGVYKGKFARYINQHFSDKTLYLFDTFEGFHSNDKTIEVSNNFSDGEQDFKNTSVERVLSIMPNREKCVIKKGYFPHTAEGMNEEFCFVSLDTDLYEPIYQGLQFFYPKLVPGGYIMIHDFNNEAYPGVRAAVEKFCNENNANFTPIPDSCGSCIICKG